MCSESSCQTYLYKKKLPLQEVGHCKENDSVAAHHSKNINTTVNMSCPSANRSQCSWTMQMRHWALNFKRESSSTIYATCLHLRLQLHFLPLRCFDCGDIGHKLAVYTDLHSQGAQGVTWTGYGSSSVRIVSGRTQQGAGAQSEWIIEQVHTGARARGGQCWIQQQPRQTLQPTPVLMLTVLQLTSQTPGMLALNLRLLHALALVATTVLETALKLTLTL